MGRGDIALRPAGRGRHRSCGSSSAAPSAAFAVFLTLHSPSRASACARTHARASWGARGNRSCGNPEALAARCGLLALANLLEAINRQCGLAEAQPRCRPTAGSRAAPGLSAASINPAWFATCAFCFHKCLGLTPHLLSPPAGQLVFPSHVAPARLGGPAWPCPAGWRGARPERQLELPHGPRLNSRRLRPALPAVQLPRVRGRAGRRLCLGVRLSAT